MGLEDILENINRTTKESVKRITDEAKGEADSIRAEAEAKAQSIMQEYSAKAESDAKQLATRELSKASIAAKMEYSAEVNKRVSKAIDSIRGNLQKYAKSPAYRKLLAALAQKAAGELGEGCTLYVQEGDMQLIKQDGKGFKVAKAKDRFAGGLKGSSIDGKREVDYTLEAILQGLHGKVALELVKLIKGGAKRGKK
ncbi:MAG: V-type ATP synthase subunit E family protein [Candidatus Marsarchaeota archaeon]|nr:V-type ATP synthase subunit E family protein [Candidatus Marsarchaeota archaeon]